MQLIERLSSNLDRTQKLVFSSKGNALEVSYIDKQDGKDILVLPSQSSCRMGCTFCFLTDPLNTAQVRNLDAEEIVDLVWACIKELGLPSQKTLLVSFMGAGEPLCNTKQLLKAMAGLSFVKEYEKVRFAVASIMPSLAGMKEFTDQVIALSLPVKFHFSMHSTVDEVRLGLMPNAKELGQSISMLRSYLARSGNPVEVHYTLIDGVNDSDDDLDRLIYRLGYLEIPVKLLQYRARPGSKASARYQYFAERLENNDIPTEIYNPPGADVLSACGQFTMKYYQPPFATIRKGAALPVGA